MTWYEIIISRPDEKAVVIEGRDLLQSAWRQFDDAAKNGRIPGCPTVRMYEEFTVSSNLLSEVLQVLGQDTLWVEDSASYQVLLYET